MAQLKLCVIGFFILTACNPACKQNGGTVPPNGPPQPVEPEPAAQDACEAAQNHLKALDCHDSAGVPMWQSKKGIAFQDFCRGSLDSGQDINPECISKVKSCADVEKASETPRGAQCP